MTTASDLVTRRVVIGRVDERLADLAPRLKAGGTHHCVVLLEDNRTFCGLIQLADLLGQPGSGNRILGDLASQVKPMVVRPADSAAQVAALFDQYQLTEAVLLGGEDHYLGVITAHRVLEWSREEYRRTETALGEAVGRMERALRAKDHFIAAVSHELRTPLTPVLLVASSAAANQALPAQLRQDFKMIADNVSQEAQLVDNLITQSQLLSSTLQVRHAPVELHVLLRELLSQAQPVARAKDLELSLDPAPGEIVVAGDPDRLNQVFSELLTNALRLTPAGGRISFKTSLSREDSFVTVRLVDSGSGLSETELAELFTPFTRLSSRPGGLGLGLAIVRGLVEMHGGKLVAESAGPGHGSAFVVRLPRWAESQPRRTAGQQPAPFASGLPVDLSAPRFPGPLPGTSRT